MDVQMLTKFFMWCTVLNGAMLMVSALMCTMGADWVYKKHGRMFSISRDAFNVAVYAFIATFKMLFLVFNLVPYVALVIIG